MKILALLLIIFAFPSYANDCKNLPFGEITTISVSNQLICHDTLVINYNPKYLNPEWVAYINTKDKLMSCAKRKDQFKTDPYILGRKSTPNDYKNSGYDKGHMGPADDFEYNDMAKIEAYYMSNVTPQLHRFNAGIWLRLEDYVRVWTYERNTNLYVIAGPTYNEVPIKIGFNNVSVPTGFYKFVIDLNSKEFMIFYFDHKVINDTELKNYLISLVDLEKKLNVKFNIPSDYKETGIWPTKLRNLTSVRKTVCK